MLSPYTRAKFRVKIKSLAEEARIIRAEEARALRPFRKSREHRKCMHGGCVEFALPKAKLEAIAKVIAKSGDSRIQTANGLHLHRIGVLREEARCTLLAYAFARGVPYGAVERTKRPFPAKRVAEIVRSLAGTDVPISSLTNWAVTTDPVMQEQVA